MNSSKSILLAPMMGAVLMTASLVIQASTPAVRASQDPKETPRPSAVRLAAREPCTQYRWGHVGHPEKGYDRRVCVDAKEKSPPVVEALDRGARNCKKSVSEHYGPPGKVMDSVKVVSVPCPKRR